MKGRIRHSGSSMVSKPALDSAEERVESSGEWRPGHCRFLLTLYTPYDRTNDVLSIEVISFYGKIQTATFQAALYR